MSSSRSQHMSSSSSSSSVWLLQHMKLKFFTRIRCLLKNGAPRKRTLQSSPEKPRTTHQDSGQASPGAAAGRSEDGRIDETVVLQRTVKKLHFGSWEEKEAAAGEIEKLAGEDEKSRRLMAELGVIQVLVSMVASEVAGRRRAAVRALIQLALGTCTNKALMVNAGICSKLPKNIEALDQPSRHELAELLHLLSSPANSQFPVASSEILPFLIETMNSDSTDIKTKETCLATVNNLSVVLENSGPLVSNRGVQTLLRLMSVKELSEKALATLGQLAVTQMGKKAMEDSLLVPESLVKILTWEDKPKCQEHSAYILMVLAHQSWSQREKMAKAGIVPALLEVSLLGSPLAQKRAMKLLQWFKDERHVRMGPHSGPQTGRVSPGIGSPMSPRSAGEGKRMMKNLVRQSLHKNMEMITRRANANVETEASMLKSLVISTSSKSLPY
ncbi:PREDICTED: U-box domain-containing protein 6-like [Tarenaya hassleriana]|uniref:U-box domain-containing protein 6-like n=1 Tax=Tarenaya hassleriana TaxID=28532 RepID=UPI00053C87B9|nr:PREDICTED: U-box domain-containing protein 6-like [Tarenaya hassleriana]